MHARDRSFLTRAFLTSVAIVAAIALTACQADPGASPDGSPTAPPPASDGVGWRLVAEGRGNADEAFSVRAATDQEEWMALWTGVAIDADRPEVDLDREVVVSFAHGIGSSCPELQLDEVAIDGDLVYSVVSDPLAPRACTADLVGSVVFVVAIERETLPEDGFTLRLREDLLGDPLEVPLP